MNIRRTGERKNIAVFAILPTVCEGCVIFTTSQTRGLVTHESRKVTSTPGVQPHRLAPHSAGREVFSGTLPTGGTRSAHLPVYGRLAIAKAIGGLNRRNAVPPSGRPGQHLPPIT